MSRTPYWLHSDGKNATIQRIAEEVMPEMTAALKLPIVDIYPSTALKTGIHRPGLQLYAPLLIRLMKLDSRGGFFGQKHVKAALQQVLEKPGTDTKRLFETQCSMKNWNSDFALDYAAYLLRVMCSHMRLVNAADHTDDDSLNDVFKHMLPTVKSKKKREDTAETDNASSLRLLVRPREVGIV